MIDFEKLSDQFDEAGLKDWRRLADQALGTRPFDQTLRSSTYDDITIEPLYAAGGQEVSVVPGLRSGRWDIRQMPLHPDPKIANREILADLEGGATSVHLKIHPASWGAGSQGCGVVIRDQADFDKTLKGFLPDVAALSLDPGPEQLRAVGMITNFWTRRAKSASDVEGEWGVDPLGALARHGQLKLPLDKELANMAVLAALAVDRWGRVRAVSVDTTVYHNAGASEGLELAAALSTGIAYLRAMEVEGLAPRDAASQIVFRFAADTDVLLGVAKLRAFRRLWQGVLESCGVADAGPARLHVLTSSRMLTRCDPWVNILRSGIAGFAASIAGADVITIDAFTAALGIPETKARRLARNIHLLWIEESNLHRVADPLAGAYCVEAITNRLAEVSWKLFQDIEGRGGMAGALRSSWFKEQVASVASERWRRLQCREELLTGVSSYPKLGEKPVDLAEVDPAIFEPRAPASDAVILVDGFDPPVAANGPGEAGDPLAPISLAEPFEDLRDWALGWAVKNGRSPRVFMANLGRPSDFIGPATYARNLFASAGFEAIGGGGIGDDEALLAALGGVEAEAAVISGTPEDCRARAGVVMALIRAAGIVPVYLAGEPDILTVEDQENMTGAFYDGIDVVAALETLHDYLEGLL